MKLKPLAVDLCAGLGGWTEALLTEGWDVVGLDIEEHAYGDHRYPAGLIIQDVLTVDGHAFSKADLIVASPPCQFFSYTAMPWSKGKALAAKVRADPALLEKELALFRSCFRIQREASKAKGRHIPMVVENVRGAIPWVGRSRWNYGSFHLWGDVPALMPITRREFKVPSTSGRRTDPGLGTRFTSRDCGTKQGGDWYSSGDDASLQRRQGSKSPGRKAASAIIAKIPEALARWIARCYLPREEAA